MSQEKEIKKEQEEVEEALKENEAQSEDAVENENTVEASKETADADTTDKASEEVKEEGKKSLFGKKKNPLQDKLDDMTDKYKRQLAEFENFRNRTEKEKSQMFDAGAGNVLTKILPVVDNFERGLAAAHGSSNL